MKLEIVTRDLCNRGPKFVWPDQGKQSEIIRSNQLRNLHVPRKRKQ